MKTVYGVWEVHAFMQPSILLHIFSTKEAADQKKESYEKSLDTKYAPEYDDYGLVSGTEFRVVEHAVEEK